MALNIKELGRLERDARAESLRGDDISARRELNIVAQAWLRPLLDLVAQQNKALELEAEGHCSKSALGPCECATHIALAAWKEAGGQE